MDLYYQVAKKVIFKSCHLGKPKLAYTNPNVISTSPKTFDEQNGFHSSSVI